MPPTVLRARDSDRSYLSFILTFLPECVTYHPSLKTGYRPSTIGLLLAHEDEDEDEDSSGRARLFPVTNDEDEDEDEGSS